MGLAEKRAVKAFQEDAYQNLVKKINMLAGYELEFEVDWNSLSANEYSHLYEKVFPDIYFNPIINAFKGITADDMGKEALQDSLKKIVIKDENDISNAKNAYALGEGVLTIDHSAYINANYVDERSESLTTLLEENL